ncbi:MAG: heavy metal-associated domain-containing protein [Pseudomonadota bacterium]
MINMSVKGMTCPHCVASVKKALEAIDGVTNADVNLENNQALIETADADFSKDVLIQAVIDAGYEAS